VEGLPTQPIVATADIERSFLLVPDGENWGPLDEYASNVRRRIGELSWAEVPNVEEVAEATAAEIDHLTNLLSEQNARRSALFRARQAELGQRASITRRIAALEEDLQKNQDAQKLRNFGSKISDILSADHCPTCSQPIQDTLLAQQASIQIMPIETNIEHIKSQRAIFQKLSVRTEATIADLERQLAAATAEANETSGRLRALRADIVAPSHAPSIAAIQQRPSGGATASSGGHSAAV
jgi:DNA repair exonuclease SbcCD ATPase subunit